LGINKHNPKKTISN